VEVNPITAAFLIFFGLIIVGIASSVVVLIWRLVRWRRDPRGFQESLQREAAREAARRRELQRAVEAGERSAWPARLFGAVFGAAGLLVVTWFGWGVYDLARAQRWQKADCTVIESRFDRHRSRNSTTYYPKIRYAYRFAGRDFAGEKYDLVKNYYDGNEIEQLLKNYPAGAKTACYVNPQDPVEAAITRSVFQFPIFRYTAGLIMCFGLSAFLFSASRRRRLP
jgi:hypothetical protein